VSNNIIPHTAADLLKLSDAQSDPALARQIQALVGNAEPLPTNERRGRDRYPICFRMQLMPVDENGQLVHDEITDVVGKDLSTTGIGFSHTRPVSRENVVIVLNHDWAGRLAVEGRIRWVRLTPVGLYDSGCQFIGTVAGHNLGGGH